MLQNVVISNCFNSAYSVGSPEFIYRGTDTKSLFLIYKLSPTLKGIEELHYKKIDVDAGGGLVADMRFVLPTRELVKVELAAIGPDCRNLPKAWAVEHLSHTQEIKLRIPVPNNVVKTLPVFQAGGGLTEVEFYDQTCKLVEEEFIKAFNIGFL